jgi:cyclase
LGKISKLGIATPLIFAGGIGSREDAVKVVSHGADRIMVDAMVRDSPQSLEAVARDLGTQAVIAHLPARMGEDGLKALDYRDRVEQPLVNWLERLPLEWVSELMVTDWSHEGSPGSFDERLLSVAQLLNKPILFFGGISEVVQLQRVLSHPQVVAAGMGNFLNFKEHAVQKLKEQLGSSALRAPHYESTL